MTELSDEEMHDFLKAWKIIQEKNDKETDSFYHIATYHGMPFDKAAEGEIVDWGGYCQHGNVLFPLWHRAYCLELERALQKAVPGTALHYWDQLDGRQQSPPKDLIPSILMKDEVEIDGKTVPNPLRSFTMVNGLEGSKDSLHKKPKGYATTRYPYSGIHNPTNFAKVAKDHNKFIDEDWGKDPDIEFKNNVLR